MAGSITPSAGIGEQDPRGLILPSCVASRTPVLTGVVLAALCLGPAYGERIDRVVSVVGERVVTETDLLLEEELRARDPSPVPALSQGGVQALEDQRWIRGHAGQVRVYQPNRRALEARIAALRRTFEAPGEWEDFLARWGMSEDTIRALMLNRMIVETTVLRTLGSPDPGHDLPWQAKYESWLEELRATGETHRADPLP
jgi:hypothetical protein